jgi:uncharacterized membrane protein YphA (DoxX/SURF4 family)
MGAEVGERTEAARVVGLKPWLPWPLCRWSWWTRPVPAERLAALRIGLAAVLLWDLLVTYLPHVADFFAEDSLGGRGLFSYLVNFPKRWQWSVLANVEDPTVLRWVVLGWVAATVCLLVGLQTRLSAVVVWILSTSFANLNEYIDNAGDQIRGIALFYLVLTPCGAVWSVDHWLRRRRGGDAGPVLIYPWALRLLFVQMVLIYWLNGLYKLTGDDWLNGDSLYYVLSDVTLTRVSYSQFPMPYRLTQVLTWSVLVWEAGFPLWVALPWTRKAALLFGVAFHLGIFLSMELGGFVPYMLTLYLPLVPWERWVGRGARAIPV